MLAPLAYETADALVAAGVMSNVQRQLFLDALEKQVEAYEAEQRRYRDLARAEYAALPWWKRMWRKEPW